MEMKVLHAVHYNDAKNYDTNALRNNFLIDSLHTKNTINACYTHYDRLVTLVASTSNNYKLTLPNYNNTKSNFFLERRELGIINIGAKGVVYVDGKEYILQHLDGLYIGKGAKEIIFASDNNNSDESIFYALSAPAHVTYPTTFINFNELPILNLGATETANERQLIKYIHNDGVQSCQLVMGVTTILQGSVWNSVPPHTHDRRSEIYFYFNVPAEHTLFHFMGTPAETRHLLVHNHQAVVAPSWSVHFGCGTTNYSFIWGMAGENKEFTDMDAAPLNQLK